MAWVRNNGLGSKQLPGSETMPGLETMAWVRNTCLGPKQLPELGTIGWVRNNAWARKNGLGSKHLPGYETHAWVRNTCLGPKQWPGSARVFHCRPWPIAMCGDHGQKGQRATLCCCSECCKQPDAKMAISCSKLFNKSI